ncbi:hypothetical protein GCM10027515_31880 [Schumannella luteola]|uniref:Uncharacterized protein n=1 Tax=Schumannella luteola TaxID=472059 RepID=A0A852YCW4_9MICO|nr:hypothetical protein [Schumannella luteola]NYG99011.1 hypothetical protein [Schumannella luteola]TPX06371.1 hypothetical protein FJ656_01690 [Schumannella luteola]
MSERRPRRSDFDLLGDYYAALLGWIQRRHPDDQIARIRRFEKAEKKEAAMPVERKAKAKPVTRHDREVAEALTQMLALEHTAAGDPTEEAELRRRHIANRTSRRYAKATAKWARRSSEPAWRARWRDEAEYVVFVVRGGKKGEAKRERKEERQLAKKRAEDEAYWAARSRPDDEPEARSTAASPGRLEREFGDLAPEPDQPRRRRRAGIVAVYNRHGDRIG